MPGQNSSPLCLMRAEVTYDSMRACTYSIFERRWFHVTSHIYIKREGSPAPSQLLGPAEFSLRVHFALLKGWAATTRHACTPLERSNALAAVIAVSANGGGPDLQWPAHRGRGSCACAASTFGWCTSEVSACRHNCACQ